MVVHFLLLICDVDGNEVGVLDVAHLDLVLLKCVSCLALAMVESPIKLLATVFYFLAHAVVFALRLA